MWKNTTELNHAIRETTDALKSGRLDIREAKVTAQLFAAATRVLAVQMEHARLTGRLEKGSNKLPPIDMAEVERVAASLG